MNILFATAVVPSPESGSGGSGVMFGELQAIAERHDVHLLTLAAPGVDEDAVAALRARGFLTTVLWVQRGWSTTFSSLTHWLARQSPLGAVDARGHLQATFRSALVGRDLVHVAASKWAGPALLRAPAVAWMPSVLTEHEAAPVERTRREGAPAFAQVIEHLDDGRWREYLTSSYRSFDQIQVFSSSDGETIARRDLSLASRVLVNPFGINVPPVTDDIRTASVVFVGNFKHPPNIDAASWLATEIMPSVRNSCPDTSLTLVGRDAKSHLAGDAVNVLGFVPDLAPIYRQAGVVVAAIRSGSGMRVKVLEAMAHGCPVVATSLAAQGLEFRDATPPLVIADTPLAIAEATIRLLRDPEEGRRLGQQARAYVAARFTWEAYAERLAIAYERAIVHHRAIAAQ